MKNPTTKRNRWEDHFSRQAKKENFPARSVYKLKEIQHKYRLIKKGDKILDLGCYPGSWLLYAAELTGKEGLVVGVDRKPVSINIPSHVKIYTCDILSIEDEFLQSMGKDFNVVISDMAPPTTGNKFVDAARSSDLSRAALSVARKVLTPGGSFLCKIFSGRGF